MKPNEPSHAEVDERALDDVQGSEVSFTGGAGIGEPLAELSSFFERRDAAGAGQGERDQRVRRAMSHQRRLQRGLFAKVQREQEFDFHASGFFERLGDVSNYIFSSFDAYSKTHRRRGHAGGAQLFVGKSGV